MADWLTNWGKDVMWKRRQRIGKGRHWPKHFIISDYSIEVKWLTDQYWPWHLCKSSYETYETQTFIISDYNIEVKWLADQYFMQVILVFGKGGNELGKGGTDPNILLFQIIV